MNQTEHQIITTTDIIKSRDPEGRSTVNQYVIVKQLGEGAHGKVKLAIKGETGSKFAIKIINKSLLKRKKEFFKDSNGVMRLKDPMLSIQREIAIMKKLNHKNIIKLHEVIDSEESQKLYLVLDFAENGQYLEWDEDLEKFSRTDGKQEFATEDELRRIFLDCLHGLEYLHHNDIAHRDLKPQNILVGESGVFKIADFGVSTLVNHDSMHDCEGTHHFLAPELCKIDFVSYSGKAADIWSMGAAFFAFTYHRVPFNASTHQELFNSILNDPLVVREDLRSVSDGLRDLLSRMLEKDPKLRISINEALNHSWIIEGTTSKEKINELKKVEVTTTEISNAFAPLISVMFVTRLLYRVKSRKSNEQVLANLEDNKNKPKRSILLKQRTIELKPNLEREGGNKKIKKCASYS